MKQYIGTKIVKAEFVPGCEKAVGDNSLNENTPDGYKVIYSDGYESWSPKGVFEESYKECNNLTFGIALEMAKKGNKIARESWLPCQFVVYQKGYPSGIPCNKQTAEAWGMQEGELFRCAPYLQMQYSEGKDNSHFMWTPNTLDILAEDWTIVE